MIVMWSIKAVTQEATVKLQLSGGLKDLANLPKLWLSDNKCGRIQCMLS